MTRRSMRSHVYKEFLRPLPAQQDSRHQSLMQIPQEIKFSGWRGVEEWPTKG